MWYLILFYLGVVLGVWLGKKETSYYIKYKTIYKKQRDVLNWLKSELALSKSIKLTKSIDRNKVKLLELIIKRLEK